MTTSTPRSRAPIAWILVGILTIAVAGLAVALIQARAGDPTETPAPSGSAESATPTPEPEPTTPPPEAAPLLPPDDHLPDSGISAIPLSEDSLEDGDYFGILHAIDPTGGTVQVDIAIFYLGQAAIDYLTENEPDAENPPPNDYHIVNDVERIRTVALAADVLIWDWCEAPGGGLQFQSRTVAEWAATPDDGVWTCGSPTFGHAWSQTYWFDVRDGEVAQVIGQYLP